jgi:hypothetical protein
VALYSFESVEHLSTLKLSLFFGFCFCHRLYMIHERQNVRIESLFPENRIQGLMLHRCNGWKLLQGRFFSSAVISGILFHSLSFTIVVHWSKVLYSYPQPDLLVRKHALPSLPVISLLYENTIVLFTTAPCTYRIVQIVVPSLCSLITNNHPDHRASRERIVGVHPSKAISHNV